MESKLGQGSPEQRIELEGSSYLRPEAFGRQLRRGAVKFATTRILPLVIGILASSCVYTYLAERQVADAVFPAISTLVITTITTDLFLRYRRITR